MKLKKINEEHYVVENNDGVITQSTQPIEIIHTSGVTMTNPPMGYIKIIELPLFEVKELLGEVYVEKRAREFILYNEQKREWWKQGYTQALEDNKERKYTEDDMRKAWNASYIDAMSIDEETYKPLFFEDFIQSLQSNTEWEVDIINGKLTLI